MMTSRLFKILAVLAVTTLVAGCKLAVIVNLGGTVQSLSGTRNCAEGTICNINITDGNFSESFTAVAKPGYQFVKWQKGSDFFCGDSTSTTCTVALSGNAAVDEAIIALFNKGYIMPVFKDVGIDTDGDGTRNELDEDDDNDGTLDADDPCPLDPDPQCGMGIPITDTIPVNGKEWAQAKLFAGLTWNQINTVCPAGLCSGILNGYDMRGWTWASVDDVNALFNYYIGSPEMGPGSDAYTTPTGSLFWNNGNGLDGWLWTYFRHYDQYATYDARLAGFTRESYQGQYGLQPIVGELQIIYYIQRTRPNEENWNTGHTVGCQFVVQNCALFVSGQGAFLYRTR